MQVTSNTQTTSADSSAYAGRVPQKTLGQDDFLKLITVQLAKQDPMKPMEDTSFIAQMAQFTALEQSNQMVKGFGELRSASELASASTLLGREVTVDGGTSDVTGAVTGIDAADGTPKLIVGGKLYSLSALKQVAANAETSVPAA